MLKRTLLIGFVGFALSACSQETKQDLGLVNTAPDEFSVITRAPLSVPPDYTLRPPRPGSARPMEISTQDTARQTIFGVKDVSQSGVAHAGQNNANGFLGKIGAVSADSNIRDIVDGERLQGVEDNRSTANKLLFWKDPDGKNQGTPIDAKEEFERLKEEGVVTIKKRNEDIEAP